MNGLRNVVYIFIHKEEWDYVISGRTDGAEDHHVK
jgi:hypothetical protein